MTSHVINGSPGYGRVSHLKLLQDPYSSLQESGYQDIDAFKNDKDNDNHTNINESNTDDDHISESSDSFEDTCDEASSFSHYPNNDSNNDANANNGQLLSPTSRLSPPIKMKEHRTSHLDDFPRPATEWIRDIKNSQAHTRFGHMIEVIDAPKEQTTLCPSPSSKRPLAISPRNIGNLQYTAPSEDFFRSGTSLTGSPIKRTGKSVSSRINTKFLKLEPLKYDDFSDGDKNSRSNKLELKSPVMQTNPLSDDDSILVSDTDSETAKIRRHGETRFLKITPQTLGTSSSSRRCRSKSGLFNITTPISSPYKFNDISPDYYKTPTGSPLHSNAKEYYDSSDSDSDAGKGKSRRYSPASPKVLKSCLSPKSSPVRNIRPAKFIQKDMDSEFSESDSDYKIKTAKASFITPKEEVKVDEEECDEEEDIRKVQTERFRMLKVTKEEINIATLEEIAKDSSNVSTDSIYNNLCAKYRIKQIKNYYKRFQFEGFQKPLPEFSLVPKHESTEPSIRDAISLRYKDCRPNNFFNPSKKLQKVRFNEAVRVRVN
ncbi:unnamed protein product [[Candida] boidinii]|nr:unnamed protein product [[Candida] boidinii]